MNQTYKAINSQYAVQQTRPSWGGQGGVGRYYAPPTFISRDPMFEKYPSISPYTYCANNPILLVDDDGQEIRIYYKEKTGIARLFEKPKSIVYTPGMVYSGGNNFVNNAVKALNYVKQGDQLGIIEKIAKNNKLIKIKETKGNTLYNPFSNTVRFNTKLGLACVDENLDETGGKQSPALGLLHELGHGFVDIFKSMSEKLFLLGTDDQYDNKEDEFVITQIETPAAKILGEGIRENHDGNGFIAKDVTSKEEINSKEKE